MAATKGQADILLKGGSIIDGSGEAARPGDVAVKDGRIEAVGDLSGWVAGSVLDASGLAVAPGFIDMHAHSDLTLLVNPRAESKLRQGVTTEVIGQCGFSLAPAPEEHRGTIRTMFGEIPLEEPLEWTWGGMGDYLEALRNRGASVNVVPVAGHAVLRAIAVGLENRPPTPAELAHMQRTLRTAMEEGAQGVSSGLVYAPSMYADTEELIALARVAAEYGGLYFTHVRGEGDGVLTALEEAARIGCESGARVEVAHLKCEGKRNWGRADSVLEALQCAQAGGADIGYDSYPYTAWNTGLAQLLPAWAREGGREAIVARLCEPETRERIRRFLADQEAEELGKWERRLVSSVESEANRAIQGMSLAAIASLRMQPAAEVIMDLLVEERGMADMVGFGMCDDDVRTFIASPLGAVCSDASTIAPYGALGVSHPHPRTYGSFARVLGKYVREERALSLESAVAKMARLPAERLGLTDRGLLAPGLAADVVVFAPDTIADRATYEAPHQYAQGVRWVIVNGVLELDGDKHLGRKPGKVLSR